MTSHLMKKYKEWKMRKKLKKLERNRREQHSFAILLLFIMPILLAWEGLTSKKKR